MLNRRSLPAGCHATSGRIRCEPWPDAGEYAAILKALPLADILKVSEEEMVLLTGESSLEKGAEKLLSCGPRAAVITLGAKGAYYYSPVGCGLVKAYKVPTVDTTGAGDAFWGALLFCLRGKSKATLAALVPKEWDEIINFANAAGSLTTTAKGAIPAMPDFKQIQSCMRLSEYLDD